MNIDRIANEQNSVHLKSTTMANFTTDASICIDRVLELKDLINPEGNVLNQYEILQTCQWIKENKFSKVCLQFPDEMLNISAKIYEEIKNRIDVDLYILGDTTYASCCVDSVAAMHVQAEAVIHYGRSCFSKTNIATLTVLPKRLLDMDAAMHITSNMFPHNDALLCLFYDAEYEHYKEFISATWFEKYPQSYIAFVELEEKEGRFLGRLIKNKDQTAIPVETLQNYTCIYLGNRGQTLFNYTISVPSKEWYLLDPHEKKIDRMDETLWFKRRRFLIEKCKDAKVIGILICKLSGDQTKDIITRMKQLCKANEKKSYIVSVGKPNVAKLANFPEIDIYVMIACPESDLYSSRDFYKPLVYPFELEVALNSNRSPYNNTHVTDFDELLPGRRYYCEINDAIDSFDMSLITGKMREAKPSSFESESRQVIAERQNWALESIGNNLSERSWTGLQQKLGETEANKAEEGRKGIPLQYKNEPDK